MSNKRYYLCVTPFFPSPGNWRGAYVFDQVKAIERQSDYRVLVFVPCGFLKAILIQNCRFNSPPHPMLTDAKLFFQRHVRRSEWTEPDTSAQSHPY